MALLAVAVAVGAARCPETGPGALERGIAMSRTGRRLLSILSILSVVALFLGGSGRVVAASGSASAVAGDGPQTAVAQAVSSHTSDSAANSSGVLSRECLASLKAPALYRAHGAKSAKSSAGLASACKQLPNLAAAKRAAAAPTASSASPRVHGPGAGSTAGSSTAKPNTAGYVSISGTLTNSASKGIANIYVNACPAAGGSSCISAYSIANGSYSITLVPANDNYVIVFDDTSNFYAYGCYDSAVSGHFSANCDLSSPELVAVGTNDVTGINATLPAMVHITGKVTNSAGAGISGILISYHSDLLKSGYSATSAVGGTYSVTVTPSASYTLQVYDSSDTYIEGYYDSAASGHWTADFGAVTAINVGSANITGINLTMPTGVHIRGTLSTTSPYGLSGGSDVFACSTTIDACFLAFSGSDGVYSVPVPRNDSYIVAVGPGMNGTLADGYYDSGASGHFAADISTATVVPVATSDVTGIDVTLPVAVTILGTVTNSTAGGLGNIDVWVCSTSGPLCYYSSSFADDGSYGAAVAPGYSYTVEFDDSSGTYASGFYEKGVTDSYTADITAATVIDGSSGDQTGIDVTLTAAVHITGTVTNPNSNGIEAIVWACESGTNSCWKTYTNASGVYSLAVLPDQDYTIEFDDGYPVHFYQDGFYDSAVAGTDFTTDQGSASAVPVAKGDVSGINVVMPFIGYGSSYHAITPARVLDTRPSGGVVVHIGLAGPFVAGTVRTFGVANMPYVGGGTSAVAVPLGATAVTGNLTITGATAPGLVALGPTMTPTGPVTTINFIGGDTRANNVTLGLASDGSLGAVFRSTKAGASVQLIFDVTGYFTPDPTASAGALYHTLVPGRVLDTRPTGGVITHIGGIGKFTSHAVHTVNIVGVTGLGWTSALVPSNAIAVTGNVTVTNPTSAGFVSFGPTVAPTPSTSSVNIAAKGATCANGVTVTLSGGKLQAVYVGGTTKDSADVIFDVTGFFTPGGTGGLEYHPIAPARYLDSSTNTGLSGPFTSSAARPLAIGGVGDIPTDAAGISANLTLVTPPSSGFAFAAPAITGTPTSSTVNAIVGQSIANGLDVALNPSGNLYLIWVGKAASKANLQLDITGYWK
jgi:hypothetical protein